MNDEVFYLPLIIEAKKTKGGSFPYSDVIIVDKRKDTINFYSLQDGSYPIKVFSFNPSLSISLKKHIVDQIKSPKKKETTNKLIIEIVNFEVPNVSILKKKPIRLNRYYSLRECIVVKANFYCLYENGNAKQFATINKDFYIYPGLEVTVPRIFDQFIELGSIYQDNNNLNNINSTRKSKKMIADTLGYTFYKNSTSTTLFNIKEPFKATDLQYLKAAFTKGYFSCFSDFQTNNICPINLNMIFNVNDSLYEVDSSAASVQALKPYVCYDGVDYFLNLGENKFVKLMLSDNSFYFILPSTIPNIYSLLSAQEKNKNSGTVAYNGNLLVGLAFNLLFGVIENKIDKFHNNKVLKDGTISSSFRKCVLDMESGDFRYIINESN